MDCWPIRQPTGRICRNRVIEEAQHLRGDRIRSGLLRTVQRRVQDHEPTTGKEVGDPLADIQWYCRIVASPDEQHRLVQVRVSVAHRREIELVQDLSRRGERASVFARKVFGVRPLLAEPTRIMNRQDVTGRTRYPSRRGERYACCVTEEWADSRSARRDEHCGDDAVGMSQRQLSRELPAHRVTDDDDRTGCGVGDEIREHRLHELRRIGSIGLVAQPETRQVHGQHLEAWEESIQHQSPAEQRFPVSVQKQQCGVAGTGPKRSQPKTPSLDPLGLVDWMRSGGLNPGDPRGEDDEGQDDPAL